MRPVDPSSQQPTEPDATGEARAAAAPTELEKVESRAGAGTEIGPYKLLQPIGAGGMGEVWQAEQTEPVRRQVALKLIKRGLDTDRVIARFEAERQALALMDHPAVARVFDAGSTSDGRPYFVMEYVSGVPVTDHCDQYRLSVDDRLSLLQQICDGVQHAHHKGIIHRDLKPSNVLVSLTDGKPVVKIIDFGIAKSVAQPLTERTLYTELGAPIGTPAYMSPEQMEMTAQGVDTRSDVYSLGVILYELLVGVLPYRKEELRGGLGKLRELRETDVPTPAARLSTLGERARDSAERRGLEPAALRRVLSGELGWVVMKALAKDRGRRYDSPAELGADLARYARDEPLVAGPPEASYRLRKFVRRHRVGVAAAVAAVMVLVGFAALMTVQARRVAAERDLAARERDAAERVAEFLADVLGELDPGSFALALRREQRQRIEEAARLEATSEDAVARQVAAWDDQAGKADSTSVARALLDREILGRFGREIEVRFANDPAIAGRLEATLAKTYSAIGMYTEAEPHGRRAIELLTASLGSEHRDTLHSGNELAEALHSQWRHAEAEKELRRILAIQERVLGPEDADTLESRLGLGFVVLRQNRPIEAERLLRETLAVEERVFGPDHRGTLDCLNGLSSVLWATGRYADAEALMRELIARERRALGELDPATLTDQTNLAIYVGSQGRSDEAIPLYREVIEKRRRVSGDEHPSTLHAQAQLGYTFYGDARYDECEAVFRELTVKYLRTFGRRHFKTAAAYEMQGTALVALGRAADAVAPLREGLAIRAELGRDEDRYHASAVGLGDALRRLGELDEATRLIEPAYEVLNERHAQETPAPLSLAQASLALAGMYAAGGDRDRGLELLRLAMKRGLASPSDQLALGEQERAVDAVRGRLAGDPDIAPLLSDPEVAAYLAGATEAP